VWPGLASGISGMEPSFTSLSSMSFIGVAIAPGATAFTRMLCFTSSIAMDLVKPPSACFAAV
jgi:hypothetical protein